MMPIQETGPQIELPFAERDLIDTQRAMRILGVCRSSLHKMIQMKLFATIQYDRMGRHQIAYSSLVRYCDALREEFGIPDRRPPLSSPLLRYPDALLLPFPLSDTVYIDEVMERLRLPKRSAHKPLEQGSIEAYRLINYSNWRVSRTSLNRYVQRMHQRAAGVRRVVISL